MGKDEEGTEEKIFAKQLKENIFLNLHNFEQKKLFLEEYTAEFDHLTMKCDLVKLKEQTIACFLRGLKPKIGNVVQL